MWHCLQVFTAWLSVLASTRVWKMWHCLQVFTAWLLVVTSTRVSKMWHCPKIFTAWLSVLTSTKVWKMWNYQKNFKAWLSVLTSTRVWKMWNYQKNFKAWLLVLTWILWKAWPSQGCCECSVAKICWLVPWKCSTIKRFPCCFSLLTRWTYPLCNVIVLGKSFGMVSNVMWMLPDFVFLAACVFCRERYFMQHVAVEWIRANWSSSEHDTEKTKTYNGKKNVAALPRGRVVGWGCLCLPIP